jgi:hypothetical protein
MTPGARYAATTRALVVGGAAAVLGPAWLDRFVPSRPRRATGERPVPRVPPITARDLLGRADDLDSTAAQHAHLAALERARKEEAAALDRALAGTRAKYERFAGGAGARGASLAAVQRESAGYREPSAAVRSARRRHADAAQAVLDEARRRGLARVRSTHANGGTR